VSNTVKAQNDYVNNVSSGMDQKTAQEVAAKQISDVLLDDMEERERVANERKKEEHNITRTESYSAPSRTEYNAPSKMEHKQVSSTPVFSDNSQNVNSDVQDKLLARIDGLTKRYNNKKEEYQKLAAMGTSSAILQSIKDEMNILSQQIEESRLKLEDEINKREKNLAGTQNNHSITQNTYYHSSQNVNSDVQDKLLARIDGLTKRYNNKKEEYQKLAAMGTSSAILQSIMDEMDILSQQIEESKQKLEDEINKREKNLSSPQNNYSVSQNTYHSSQNVNSDVQDKLLARIDGLTKRYNNKKEEYQKLAAMGTSSAILQSIKDEMNILSRQIEESRQKLEDEINKREKNFSSPQNNYSVSQNTDSYSQSENLDVLKAEISSADSKSIRSQNETAELRTLFDDMTKEYWEKSEEYQQLVTNGSSNSILKYKKEALDALSKRIKEVRQILGEVSYKEQEEYSDEQAELKAIISDMTIEYWGKSEEYQQLVANGGSNLVLKYKKDSLDALSKRIEELTQLLEK
jgi:hypothetical protein